MRKIRYFAPLIISAGLISACAEISSEPLESTDSTKAAIVGVDTWAYLRCNATGWSLDDTTRLKPSTVPNRWTLDFTVSQDWMVSSNDSCIITETNQFNGWGTTSTSRTLNPRVVTPQAGAQLANGYDYFFVDYAQKGTYRATVDFGAGTFLIEPATTQSPLELVETDILTRWSAGSEDQANTQLTVLGPSDIVSGQTALRAVTNSGFDFWLKYQAPTPLSAGTSEYLGLSVRGLNTTAIGWQVNGPVIVISDTTGGKLTLSPDSQYLSSNGTTWVHLRAPIAGGNGWTAQGSANLQQIATIELHADTWDYGFTLDVDNVRFTSRFDTCASTPVAMTVQGTTTATTATLSYNGVDGALGYHIYRGIAGATPTYLTRARGTEFVDSGLSAAGSVKYEVRPVLSSGCEGGQGSTTVTTTANNPLLHKTPNLKILVPIYNGGPSPYSASEIETIKNSLGWSRQFYYRNSRAQVNLAFDFMVVDTVLPDTSGPTLTNVETDLRTRGIVDNQYDAVYVIARELGGCYGGFQLLGNTAGSFGVECGVPLPVNDMTVDPTMAWVFTHEFQHAFDFVLAEGSGADMIHGHPDAVYQDMPYSGPIIDAGEHFDWEGATLRAFTGYNTLAAPHDKYLESLDSDSDGLVDSDARLPSDELRFGSNATTADSDADGLDDLGEYSAGVYSASNPTVRDTDADGKPDGVDPTPRAAIAASITSATPLIDGSRDSSYSLFRNGVEMTQVPGFTAATYLAYDANYLYILAEESMPASLVVYIDGSGVNGFWQGDDTYAISLSPNATAPLNHTTFHGTTGDGVPMPNAQLVTSVSGSTTVLEARIPRSGLGQGFGWTGATTSGFSTSQGNVLGLRIWFSRINGIGELHGEPWALQNELFHFDDITLN